MAVPPAYADLGKSAKDIFNKGYGNYKQYGLEFIYSYSGDILANRNASPKCSYSLKFCWQVLDWLSLMWKQSLQVEW